MMTKKDFIALADSIRDHNEHCEEYGVQKFIGEQLDTLAAFCHSCNPRFNRDRWLAYIRGECGPNGGRIRKPKPGQLIFTSCNGCGELTTDCDCEPKGGA